VVEWGKAPWTLRAYVVISLAAVIVVAIVVPSTPVTPRLFFVALQVVVCFFLLRGVRWLWLLMIALIVLGFIPEVIEGNLRWYGILQDIAALVFLLHPATREFFGGNQTATASN
jgi:hypothetical protein